MTTWQDRIHQIWEKTPVGLKIVEVYTLMLSVIGYIGTSYYLFVSFIDFHYRESQFGGEYWPIGLRLALMLTIFASSNLFITYILTTRLQYSRIIAIIILAVFGISQPFALGPVLIIPLGILAIDTKTRDYLQEDDTITCHETAS